VQTCNTSERKNGQPNIDELMQEKDDVIDRLNQSILSKEISLSEALGRLDDLETSVRQANEAAAERKKQLDKASIALESMTKQLSDSKQLLESVSDRAQHFEDTVKQKDTEVIRLSCDLGEKIRQVEILAKRVDDLSEQLHQVNSKLRETIENENQLIMEFSQTRAIAEELERNLTSARAACDLQQLAAKNDRGRFEEKINSLQTANESLLEELRRVKVNEVNKFTDKVTDKVIASDISPPFKINSPQSRRTTVITVKHHKTSTLPVLHQAESPVSSNECLETLEVSCCFIYLFVYLFSVLHIICIISK